MQDNNQITGFIDYKDQSLKVCILEAEYTVCIIWCNPLLEERLNCHPYYVWLSRYCEEIGISTVRFDYLGTGESSSPSLTYSIDKYADQINHIANLIRAKYKDIKLGIAGIASASLILTRLLDNKLYDFYILIEPVIDIDSYIENLFRANVLTQQIIYGKSIETTTDLKTKLNNNQPIFVDGHGITQEYIDSIIAAKLYDWLITDKPAYIAALTTSSLKKYNEIIGSDTQNISLSFHPVAAHFWKTATTKYEMLPLVFTDHLGNWLTKWKN